MRKYLPFLLALVFGLLLLAGCHRHISSATNPGTDARMISNKAPLHPTHREAAGEPSKFETVNNLAGVTMTVKKGTASVSGLTVTFNNESNSKCIYGEDFQLERKLKGRWYKVPVVVKGDYGFNDIGFELASGKNRDWTIDWKWLYGRLASGDYRIVKDIMDFRGPGDYDQYYLAAEFNIPNDLGLSVQPSTKSQ